IVCGTEGLTDGWPIKNRIPCTGSTRDTGIWSDPTFSHPGGGVAIRFPSHPAVNHAALSSFNRQRVSFGLTGIVLSTCISTFCPVTVYVKVTFPRGGMVSKNG